MIPEKITTSLSEKSLFDEPKQHPICTGTVLEVANGNGECCNLLLEVKKQ